LSCFCSSSHTSPDRGWITTALTIVIFPDLSL
jgi:hypothetical protein